MENEPKQTPINLGVPKPATIPHSPITSGGGYIGLTKREYFAAMIIQGMWANTVATDELNRKHDDPEKIFRAISVSAVNQADSLITELNKEKK